VTVKALRPVAHRRFTLDSRPRYWWRRETLVVPLERLNGSDPRAGSRYPHHDTTSADDAIETLRRSGVADELIARMMGGNADAQYGVATEQVRR
jgi:hypothetical protein